MWIGFYGANHLATGTFVQSFYPVKKTQLYYSSCKSTFLQGEQFYKEFLFGLKLVEIIFSFRVRFGHNP